jgi:hypothetical protein
LRAEGREKTGTQGTLLHTLKWGQMKICAMPRNTARTSSPPSEK